MNLFKMELLNAIWRTYFYNILLTMNFVNKSCKNKFGNGGALSIMHVTTTTMVLYIYTILYYTDKF